MKMAKMRGGGMKTQPKMTARGGKMKMARKMRGGGMNNNQELYRLFEQQEKINA